MNHDALFKKLLRTPTILQGFFDAFLPQTGQFVDFARLEFVDKELFTTDGKKRTGDLLVKTRLRGEAAGFLIRLEHQAQPDPDLARRLLEYFVLDWRQYNLPVYPIAVLSYQKATAPEPLLPLAVDFPNLRVLSFNFEIIHLGQMNAASFLKRPNAAGLALAARMRFDNNERIPLTRDFFISLAHTSADPEVKELVAGFFSAYQPLTREEGLQLEKEISKVTPSAVREKIMNLTNPFIELGKQRGRQEGRQEGESDLILRQLSRRLGAISALQEEEIRKLPLAKIEDLGEALLEFSSPADLALWLNRNK